MYEFVPTLDADHESAGKNTRENKARRGIEVKGLHERVREAGGRLDIQSSKKRKSHTMVAKLPLLKKSAARAGAAATTTQ